MSNARVPAMIRSKPRRRFYEAVVFLHAVTQAWQRNRQAVSHDAIMPPKNSSLEGIFKEFVNRLSQFCDIKLGGDFVTAFTVLDREGRIEYRFACNRANQTQLGRMAAFVTELLTMLREKGTPGNGELDDHHQALLEKVLTHCRVKIHTYLRALKTACRECLATKPTERASLEQLQELEAAARDADFGNLEPDIFAQRCKALMNLIENCQQQNNGNILAERPAQSNMSQSSSSCWSNLRHYAGRLHSYSAGIRTMMTAAKNSPHLVEHFKVTSVRSSSPDSNPFSNNTDVTADEILRRMVPAPAQAVQYSALVEDIRSIDINTTIKEIITQPTFRPIVHAELLVLQSLEEDSLTNPSQFFNCWKYIGCSKFTCRLCHWYFEHHNGGFQVRPTHGNLYINWKPPDVFQRDGEAAIKARERMLNTMNVHIRAEGLRTLTEKVPTGRLHDSSTGLTFSIVPNAIAEYSRREIDMETSFDEQDDDDPRS